MKCIQEYLGDLTHNGSTDYSVRKGHNYKYKHYVNQAVAVSDQHWEIFSRFCWIFGHKFSPVASKNVPFEEEY